GEIVDVKKLAAGIAAAPDHNLARACHFRFVKAAQERRRNVAGLGMKIVARAVKIGRHRRDEIASVLAPVRLTKFYAGDFGHRVSLVGRLQAARQQRLLGNRLGSLARIDARRAEEQKLFHARAVGGVDDVSFNEQVIVKKIRRESVVGAQSPDTTGREKNDL